MSHRRESGAIPPWVIPENCNSNASPTVVTPARVSRTAQNIFNYDPPPRDTQTTSLATPTARNQQSSVPLDNKSSVASASGDTASGCQVSKDSLLINNGQIVNNDHIQTASIYIANGKICDVGHNLKVPPDTPRVDASGLLVLPGGVDFATYIQEDAKNCDVEAYLNTTKEAILGGTTTIMDTVICPKGRLPVDVVTEYLSRIPDCHPWCDIVLRVGLLEINDTQLEQMEQLVRSHGINSFMFFVSWSDSELDSYQGALSPSHLHMALQKCRQLGATVVVRPHNWPLSSGDARMRPELELRASEQSIMLSASTNCPMIIASPHSLGAVEEVVRARRRVPPAHVQASCAPSSLLPTNINGQPFPSKFLSLLSTFDVTAISSDQCGPKPPTSSARLGAIGQRMVAVWEAGVPSGWLDASTFVSLVSANAAKHAGIYPQKGHISTGVDADLVLWPTSGLTHPGNGRPNMVLLRGQIVAREGVLADKAVDTIPAVMVGGSRAMNKVPEPQGKFIPTAPFPTAVYGPVMATERLKKLRQLPIARDPWSMGALVSETPPPLPTTATPPTTLPTEIQTDNVNAINAPATPEKTPEAPPSQSSPNVPTIRMIHGHRDLHASGFSLSGAQVDDDQPTRTGIRTRQPPGGVSRNPLW